MNLWAGIPASSICAASPLVACACLGMIELPRLMNPEMAQVGQDHGAGNDRFLR